MTDREFQIGSVVCGELILGDQRTDGYEHLDPSRVLYFDGQVGKAFQEGVRFRFRFARCELPTRLH